MRESVIHSTKNDNLYLYDAQHEFSMLIHPELGKVYQKSIHADSYYLKKYKYLRRYGFWGKSEPVVFETTLDESKIKEEIVNARRLVFEVTEHCNLNCTYCTLGELYDFGDKKRRRKRNINISYAINLLKYVFDLKQRNKEKELLISFYGGEPLVNIQFIKQIVKKANQLNSEAALVLGFAMTTNATLLHKHIHFLVENNFRLMISLDGNEEGHSYRVFANNDKNSFQQVVTNINMIQRDFPAYFTNNIQFNAVLHNRNSVKSIYEFVYSRYHKIPHISPLSKAEILHLDKKYLFERMFLDKRKSEEEYEDDVPNPIPGTRETFVSYKELYQFVKSCSINFYILNLLYLLFGKSKLFPTDTCIPFSRKIFLNTRHDLLPCEKVHNKYAFGKVNKSVYIDFSGIAQKFNFYYDQFKKVCENCYAYRSCDVCLLKIGNLDKLDTEKLVCYGFKDQEALKNELYRIFSLLEQEPCFFQRMN